MSDFVRDLEAELISAAHRRASPPPPPSEPRLRPLLARGGGGGRGAGIRRRAASARPAPAPDPPACPAAGAFTVPLADRQVPCAAGGRGAHDRSRPREALSDAIALLRTRGGARGAAPPTMRGEWNRPFGTWLPVGSYAPGSERKPQDAWKLFVLPTARRADRARWRAAPRRAAAPGACLDLQATPGEPVATRCFTVAEIAAGRAFALADVSSVGTRGCWASCRTAPARVDLEQRAAVRARAPGARERGPGLHPEG